ncbi:MAG: hypothetical protein LBE08_03455 [Bifidobacteriaceae bacterium]|nr:hypothetical protein [Bifidobacteriaceae bacterium]
MNTTGQIVLARLGAPLPSSALASTMPSAPAAASTAPSAALAPSASPMPSARPPLS